MCPPQCLCGKGAVPRPQQQASERCNRDAEDQEVDDCEGQNRLGGGKGRGEIQPAGGLEGQRSYWMKDTSAMECGGPPQKAAQCH